MKKILGIAAVLGLMGVVTGTAQEADTAPSRASDKMQRAWLWREGTKFTGTTLVFTSDKKIAIKPSKEKLHIYSKNYVSNWGSNGSALIFTPGHVYLQGPDKTIGEDFSFVTFEFKNLKVDGSEMTGTCTFSISYGFKGDKELKKLKGDIVPVKFTSSDLPTKLATSPAQNKPWLKGLDCSDEKNIGRMYNGDLFPQELRPDEKGGYRNIVKEMLARHAGKSPKEQYESTLNDIKRERDKLWLETGTYRQELVNADHFLVAYISQKWGNSLVQGLATTPLGILSYDLFKYPHHYVINKPVIKGKLCTAPESPPSWSAIKAGMDGNRSASDSTLFSPPNRNYLIPFIPAS